MSKVAFIGADPGLSGAIALYVPHVPETKGPFIEVFDMPTHEVGETRTVNFWGLATILGNWAKGFDVKAVVERVHAIPNYMRPDGKKQGMSSSASFNFGFAAGALQQAIASAGVPMTLVSPATWKVIYQLRGGKENKDASRAKASQLFPTCANLWARKKDDGRAEAVLLAHYGSKLQ